MTFPLKSKENDRLFPSRATSRDKERLSEVRHVQSRSLIFTLSGRRFAELDKTKLTLNGKRASTNGLTVEISRAKSKTWLALVSNGYISCQGNLFMALHGFHDLVGARYGKEPTIPLTGQQPYKRQWRPRVCMPSVISVPVFVKN